MHYHLTTHFSERSKWVCSALVACRTETCKLWSHSCWLLPLQSRPQCQIRSTALWTLRKLCSVAIRFVHKDMFKRHLLMSQHFKSIKPCFHNEQHTFCNSRRSNVSTPTHAPFRMYHQQRLVSHHSLVGSLATNANVDCVAMLWMHNPWNATVLVYQRHWCRWQHRLHWHCQHLMTMHLTTMLMVGKICCV